jgi:hypothetical protein
MILSITKLSIIIKKHDTQQYDTIRWVSCFLQAECSYPECCCAERLSATFGDLILFFYSNFSLPPSHYSHILKTKYFKRLRSCIDIFIKHFTTVNYHDAVSYDCKMFILLANRPINIFLMPMIIMLIVTAMQQFGASL